MIEEFWKKYIGKGENGQPSVVSYFEYFKKGFQDGLPHKMREEYMNANEGGGKERELRECADKKLKLHIRRRSCQGA